VAPLSKAKMSLAAARIYCTISPPLSGAMKDCSIVRVQQLQMLYRRRYCITTHVWLAVTWSGIYQTSVNNVVTNMSVTPR